MFKHEKQLFHPVRIERPNPQYAALLQEQLGGGNGELKAAMQYMSQSFRIKESGSNQDFGTTKAAKMYFSLSDPGPNTFAGNPVNPPKFSN